MVFKSKYANESWRVGDTRIKRTFAWLPFRIGNDMVWLETYETLQMYVLNEYKNETKLYQVYEWVNISHRIIYE